MWAEGTDRSDRTECTVTATHCDFQEIRSCPSWMFHVFSCLDFTYLFDSPLDADALEKSLSTTLDAYPVLAGRYMNFGARVACNNHGVPLTVATLSGHSIHDIPTDPPKGAFCDIRNLEKVADGEEAILTVMLTLFDDGCALGVAMNHGCSDGGSFGAFMHDWSNCHAGKQIEPVLMGFPATALRVPSREELDRFTGTETSFVKDLLDEYSDPNSTKRADKAASAAAPPGRRRLHFSHHTLQQLKSEAEEGADTWVSTNEALLAHVYTLLLDAAGVYHNDREKCGIVLSVDMRGKVELIPRRMLGRAVVNTDDFGGEELLVDLSDPAKAGERVHHAMREELDSSKLLCRHEVGNYFFATHIPLKGPLPESRYKLSWNFQGKIPFYAIDFGAGTAIRGVPWNCGEEVKVAPCAQGGLDVFISDTASLHGWAEHDFVGQVVTVNQLRSPMQ